MKKSVGWLLGLFLMVHFSTISFAEETIRITNGEWTPFLSEGLEHYGVVSRIVAESFALEGVKVKYRFFPWARAYKLVKSGDWDGSVVWSRTPEREKDVYFSDPLLVSYDVFFHLLLSKKIERNKRMLILFNKGLKRLNESGRLKQYFEDYRKGGRGQGIGSGAA